MKFSFSGDGKAEKLFLSIDWENHPLGSASGWPSNLKTVLSLVFNSHLPMQLYWSDRLFQFFNDAYIPNLTQEEAVTLMGQPSYEDRFGLRKVMKQGQAIWLENQIIKNFRDGQMRESYWCYSLSPVLNEDDTVGGILVICSEVTKQILAERQIQEKEKALSEAREELQTFLMQAPIGVGILNGPNHVVTFVNPKCMNFLFPGMPVSNLLNKPVREALPDLEGQGFFEILDGVYSTGKPFSVAKYKGSFKQDDGTLKELFLNFTYQPKRDCEGHINGTLVVIYEVTDRVNERREFELLTSNLRAAIRARDTFLGVASHELNTPLTSIKLQAELSKRLLMRRGPGALNPEKIKRLIDTTLTQIERLTCLIDDMLDVSRINCGKLSVELKYTNLSTLMEKILLKFKSRLQRAGCALTQDIAPDIILPVDAMRIEQVLTNLITNALKYAPGRPLHVKLGNEHQMATVSFQDGGQGISPENQERIFGRFERAGTPHDVTGLGLGLFICKQIIEEHHGHIFVESKPHEGSTFRFHLPLNNVHS